MLITQTAQSGVDVRGLVPIAGRGNYYVGIGDPGSVQWAVSDLSAAEVLTVTDLVAHAESIRTGGAVVIDANLALPVIQHVVDLAADRRICLLPTSPGRGRPAASVPLAGFPHRLECARG